jgi:hypothetical protein
MAKLILCCVLLCILILGFAPGLNARVTVDRPIDGGEGRIDDIGAIGKVVVAVIVLPIIMEML